MPFREFVNFLKRKNKTYALSYIAIGFLFIIWILFLDANSWMTQRELNLEIEKLENQKQKLKKAIDRDQKMINQLEDIDSLERFAREYYGHKKENDKIFLIDTSSIDEEQ